MQHTVYASSDTYPLAILIKATAFDLNEIDAAYMLPLEQRGVTRDTCIVIPLEYTATGKATATFIAEQMITILPNLDSIGVRYIYCADANYFKWLTKAKKAEPNLGYLLACKIKGFEHMQVILGVNHRSLFYNPANEPKLIMSLDTLGDVLRGNYQGIGAGIIKAASYPSGAVAIRAALQHLVHQEPELSCDLETGSLDFDKAGIGTVTLCWSQHEGIAFACDYEANPEGKDAAGNYGYLRPNPEVRAELKNFFTQYKGTIKWHNAPYDLSILIYELWMDDLLDTNGLLTGLEVLTERFHDTKIIAYLATNSAAGNELGLKTLAHPFAGNWANAEITDIRKIPLPELLEYNLIDGLSTNYVFDKYYPLMISEQQLILYNTLFMPSQKVIIQVEMTGMPLNPLRVQQARQELEKIVSESSEVIQTSPVIAAFNLRLRTEAMTASNEALKTKQHPISYFSDPLTKHYKVFNPASPVQLQKLLYEETEMALPVLHKTKTKQPSTGGKTLGMLVNHTTDPEYIAILESLIVMATARKILESFIPAFEAAIDKGDGVVWLHGSFNLGGTKSGRLSSSGPNLQNIPSTSTYADLIKGCFEAPKGWIFCGADFNSLEDYISALTTRDPNKLKVYLDGYDGHCLRAFNYFPQELPGISDTVDSINSIEKLFPEIRQKSKGPTFALTYQGTWRTLMTNLGLPEASAKGIETNYHELYKVSDAWVQDRLDEAASNGFVTLAFGLRLRTPLLAKTLRGRQSTPYEAAAESRTAGNALGQSYGLLNNRAMNAFMARVWASPYRLDIKPAAMIHDAIYLIIKDDSDVLEWVNNELIEAMEWQELPELAHDQVRLGAGLEVYWPNWANKIGVPNKASQSEINATCKAGIDKYQSSNEV